MVNGNLFQVGSETFTINTLPDYTSTTKHIQHVRTGLLIGFLRFKPDGNIVIDTKDKYRTYCEAVVNMMKHEN